MLTMVITAGHIKDGEFDAPPAEPGWPGTSTTDTRTPGEASTGVAARPHDLVEQRLPSELVLGAYIVLGPV